MIRTTMNGGRDVLELPEHRKVRWDELPFWEKPRLDSMRANLRPGDVLYDVGTEEGDLSALFARWVEQRGVSKLGGVVLMEPNPRVWPNIRAIWEANDLADPLLTWCGFAGPDTTTRPDWTNYFDGRGEHDATTWPECAYGPLIGDHGFLNLSERAEEVPTLSLDDLHRVIARAPDAITMDVEGSELRVLQGCTHLLMEHRPLVWVSIHPEFMRDLYGDTVADLVEFMDGFGYQREHLAAEHEWHTFFYPEEREVALPYGGTR